MEGDDGVWGMDTSYPVRRRTTWRVVRCTGVEKERTTSRGASGVEKRITTQVDLGSRTEEDSLQRPKDGSGCVTTEKTKVRSLLNHLSSYTSNPWVREETKLNVGPHTWKRLLFVTGVVFSIEGTSTTFWSEVREITLRDHPLFLFFTISNHDNTKLRLLTRKITE